jgi:glycosyltransferase involved in cell wall biosynthesis
MANRLRQFIFKKILIIAYHFPPSAAVGALRPQKFAKYLPEFGWEPHVLTIREEFAEKTDQERLADVKDIDIVRTDFWRSPLRLVLEARAKWKNDRVKEKTTPQSPSEVSVCQTTKKTLSALIKQFVWEINTFPDAEAFWTFPAVAAGLRLIRRKHIQCVYATVPEPTAAVIGYFLSLLTGASLVVDFRDPWIGEQVRDELCSETYKKLEAWLERLIITRSSKVICTNDNFLHILKNRYHDLPPEKFVTITNGFDPEEIAAVPERALNARFVITYLGTFYLDRNPEKFIQALKTGIDAGLFSAMDIEVRLIGQVETAGNLSIRNLVSRNSLDGVVRIIGQQPHSVALQEMVASDLLLLFAPNQPNQVPAKAFEYIGARRPVLALTEEGATADLIRETKAGLVVRQDDPEGILAALKDMLALHQAKERPWYRGCDLAKFERRVLAGELAALLDDAIDNAEN